MRDIKLRITLLLCLIIIMVVYSVCVHCSFGESNMDRYHNVDELTDGNVKIGYVQYDESFSGVESIGLTAEEELQGYFDAFDSVECVFVVKATGNIKFSYLATFQEMVIEQVLRGDGKVGETVNCIFQAGRLETEEDGQVYLNTFGVNLMQKDKEYLLFCSPCDMSNYSDDIYYTNENGICYFALDNTNVAVVNDDRTLIYDDESSRYEFYVDSSEAIESITDFKHKIMERYYPF